jgi:cyclophilin family peptidyl-prolyl cis-trans isomerase
MKRISSFGLGALAVLFVAGVAAAQENKPEAPAKPAASQPEKPAKVERAWVELQTDKGNIVLELDGVKAPLSTANFLAYVEKGHYDGTIFHRTISDFMIQGGGMTKEGSPKPTDPPIKNEAGNGLKNKRGTLAMARTADLNSATSQFYINTGDNDGTGPRGIDLDRGRYTVFGKVVEGMDVVDAIKDAPTVQDGRENSTPKTPVVIVKARRLSDEEAKKYSEPAPKDEAPKTPTKGS